MSDEQFQKQILKRLDVLISLQLDTPVEAQSSMAAKIERLRTLGLSPSEIANILCKPLNYVTANLSIKKKSRLKGKESNARH